MSFIRTDRGEFVSLAEIGRVERETFERPGKPDDGVRKFNLYGRDDELLGSLKVTEERIHFLLAEIIPAQPGQKLITLHFNDEDESVEHYEHQIIAWAFEPGSESPSPITTEGNVYAASGITVLIEMPDGKFDEPYVAIHDSLDAAKAEFLRQHTRRRVPNSTS